MHAFKGKIVQRKSGGLPATAAKWRLRLAGWGVAAVAAVAILACGQAFAASLAIWDGEWEIDVEESLKVLPEGARRSFDRDVPKDLRESLTTLTAAPDDKTSKVVIRIPKQSEDVSLNCSLEQTSEPDVLLAQCSVSGREKKELIKLRVMREGAQVLIYDPAGLPYVVAVKRTPELQAEREALKAKQAEEGSKLSQGVGMLTGVWAVDDARTKANLPASHAKYKSSLYGLVGNHPDMAFDVKQGKFKPYGPAQAFSQTAFERKDNSIAISNSKLHPASLRMESDTAFRIEARGEKNVFIYYKKISSDPKEYYKGHAFLSKSF